MAVKRFTEEEMELLRKNPYTYRVTYNMLLLTVEFKEKFLETLPSRFFTSVYF